MPKRPTKGLKGVYVELPPDLIAEGKTFAEKRGDSFRDMVEQAIRRHMKYPPPPVLPPPPVPPPPLPEPAPFPDSATAVPKKKAKK